MTKAQDLHLATQRAIQLNVEKARRVAEDEYPRSIAQRLEMEAAAGNYVAYIPNSTKNSGCAQAYLRRVIELAEKDGFYATLAAVDNGTMAFISWKIAETATSPGLPCLVD